MRKRLLSLLPIFLAVVLIAAVSTTLIDFFMPGSQPGESGNIEHPDKCDNCHGGYDQAIEPAFNWRGSMMAQAARDPLFYACLAIAEQDAPGSGDLCIRCHAPDGWLAGRSTPTDGSALNNNDREGVQCDFCHKLVKPTDIGLNPFPDDIAYTTGTYQSDQDYLGVITLIPPQSGNGMYVAHSSNAKRGPFTDAAAKHQIFYSPFHSQSDLCGTCHDVSSPAIDKDGNFSLGGINKDISAFQTTNMLPIERTFSEWEMSAFNSSSGVASADFGGNKTNVSTCQDCHMMDVSGYAANKRGTVYRDNLPLHDMTGGNTFIPDLVALLYPDEVNASALDAGKQRAMYMLQHAASLHLSVANDVATVTVTNNTGHKLPSGYPEGRRIWINLKAYDTSDNLVFESGAYDTGTAELDEENTKIYEINLGMTDEVEAAAGVSGDPVTGESFHFVLNNKVVKDNRIPPLGFTNEKFIAIQSPVVGYSYADGQNYDISQYVLPSGISYVKASLLYQTVSKEYVEFLRDENATNNAGQLLFDLWAANGKSAPVVMCEEEWGTPPTPPLMPIYANILSFTRGSAKGSKEYVTALVNMTDDNGAGISGALVSGSFSGATNESVSGSTGSDGTVTLTSRSIRSPVGEWCLDITGVSKAGFEFNSPVSACESSLKSASMKAATDELFNVYPNPFTDNIYFEISRTTDDNLRIELFDLNGKLIQLVKEQEIKANQSYRIECNAQSLNNDVLVYRVTLTNETYSGKLIRK
ncbi:T9SS type A sorting domain-containing protein [Mangrovibacterium diazotrophicum]|uniref:Putative secreted protein (Por secretion system target) n=1 Tax=Mangrovibacterium diazotrophicum TaxID=1261403 RepID=A0A419VUC8_9BACT|nr:T9SS type A sorting domain-containing protein [Mangrovibacterium diazotrophicum]RKD85044.1 putative secreted protein (Por secretion system target) [Mangrovibacterium diazotrophicum]